MAWWLTDEKVERVRKLHRAGMSIPVLAARFSLSKVTVEDIVKYRTHKEPHGAEIRYWVRTDGQR